MLSFIKKSIFIFPTSPQTSHNINRKGGKNAFKLTRIQIRIRTIHGVYHTTIIFFLGQKYEEDKSRFM